MSFSELIVYIGFVVGFALTPGPNMMLYLTYTFEYGRKAGWATAAGVVSSFLVHITTIVLGLTALLIASPHALDILRYTGIAYLFYLAVINLKTVQWKSGAGPHTDNGLRFFYLRGFIGNLLNPGSLVLYFSVLPQFIHPERGHVLAQNLMLGGIQMLCSFLTNCSIVYLAGFAGEAFFKQERYQRMVRYCMSFFIVLFALKMLLMR